MVKRTVDAQVLVSPGLKDAPVLDLMCSHFVLTLAAKQGGKFNVRRDLNGLLSLAGRHLVWPAPALARLREFLGRRCKDNEFWRGHEQLSTADFLERHGVWRGPYEEGTLFFYLDEYAKDQPKDLLSVLAATGEWLDARAEEAVDAGGEEHRRPVRPAAAQSGRARPAAVRHPGALPARPAQPAGGVQGQQRAGGLRRDRRGGRRQRRRGGRGAARRLAAGAHRAGGEPDLRAQHHRPGGPDEGQREAAAGADARVPRPERTDGGVHPPERQERAGAGRLRLRRRTTRRCCAPCCATRSIARSRASTCCCTARRAPARPSWPRWWRRPPGWSCSRSSTPTATATRCPGATATARCRSPRCSSRAARRPRCCSTRSRTCSRRSAREAAQLMARAEQVAAPSSGSVSGKAWVNQILESNPVPTLWVTNRIEQIDPAFRRRFAYHLELKSPPPGRARGAGAQDAGRRRGVGGLRRPADRAQGPDAGADPHRGAFRRAGRGRRSCRGEPDRAPAAQRRPGAGQPRAAARCARRSPPTTWRMLNVESALRGPAHRRGAARRRGHGTCASTARRAPARRRWPSTSPAAWTARCWSSRPAT